ncbi:MAG: hypothetical protein KF781_07270 [Chitinophagaceae bacterium]|nr:hypothetical protein [Chitinophagaceae bacterium]MCW5903976.1 hypothetical protein [Chitinophagaceae bacterium]
MNKKLATKLKLWDEIHTEYLTNLYSENATNTTFFEDLVAICKNQQDLHKVMTWLIKHHYDNGNRLPDMLIEKVIINCQNINNWEAKLHLLQIMPHIKLSEVSMLTFEPFIRNCLADKNKFVRAWAYNGLYELTKYIPELKHELKFICEKAMETESAAIKSKVRKILLTINKRNS